MARYFLEFFGDAFVKCQLYSWPFLPHLTPVLLSPEDLRVIKTKQRKSSPAEVSKEPTQHPVHRAGGGCRRDPGSNPALALEWCALGGHQAQISQPLSHVATSC